MEQAATSTSASLRPINAEAISIIRQSYDEQEARTASTLGRDVKHAERVNMAISGLLKFCQGEPIAAVESARIEMERHLIAGETVGTALSFALGGE